MTVGFSLRDSHPSQAPFLCFTSLERSALCMSRLFVATTQQSKRKAQTVLARAGRPLSIHFDLNPEQAFLTSLVRARTSSSPQLMHPPCPPEASLCGRQMQSQLGRKSREASPEVACSSCERGQPQIHSQQAMAISTSTFWAQAKQ